MFYESNCHRWEATCICRSTHWICIDISLVKNKNLNSIVYVSLEELRMNNMQTKKYYGKVCNLEHVLFSHPSLSESASMSISFSNFNNLFLWRNDGEFWYYCIIIARENVFHPFKIGRVSYGVRLISYNAVSAPYGSRPLSVLFVTIASFVMCRKSSYTLIMCCYLYYGDECSCGSVVRAFALYAYGLWLFLLRWFLFNISLFYTQLFLIWMFVSLCTTMVNTGKWLCYMHVIAIIYRFLVKTFFFS